MDAAVETPEVVDLDKLGSNLPIPDVSDNKDFSSLKKNSLEARRLTGDIPVATPRSDRPISQPDANTAQLVDDATTGDEPGSTAPEIKNPDARARILERDNRILSARMNQLLDAINQANIQQYQANQMVQEVDEVDDDLPEDPLSRIYSKVENVERKLTDQEKLNQYREFYESEMAVLNKADNLLRAEREKAPEEFDSIIGFLARVAMEQVQEDYPNLTEPEQMQVVAQTVNQKKMEWVKSGKNPADEYKKLAKRYNFVPEKKEQSQAKPAVQKTTNARQEIQKAKSKDETLNSLGSGAQAAPAKQNPVNAGVVGKMSEDEWNRHLDQLVSDGTLAAPIGSRTPSFRDLMPNKGKRVR